jgi:hypothetical protein
MAGQRKPRPKRPTVSYSSVSRPPRFVSDATGRTLEVVLPYTEYQELLRLLARHADWETLSPYLQDAIDNVLADDALAEGGTPIPLRQVIADTSEPAS